MNRIVVKSKVDSNGILQLTLPVGLADANRDVQVTVESVGAASMSQEEWRRHVLETAGKWQGNFERPESKVMEERMPLP